MKVFHQNHYAEVQAQVSSIIQVFPDHCQCSNISEQFRFLIPKSSYTPISGSLMQIEEQLNIVQIRPTEPTLVGLSPSTSSCTTPISSCRWPMGAIQSLLQTGVAAINRSSQETRWALYDVAAASASTPLCFLRKGASPDV